MSKGSTQRPCDQDKFSESFDRIFGKSKLEQQLEDAKEVWSYPPSRTTTPKGAKSIQPGEWKDASHLNECTACGKSFFGVAGRNICTPCGDKE